MKKNKPLKIACIQMTSSRNIEQNLETASRLVHEAAKGGVHLVVLPENFTTFSMSDQYSIGLAEQTSKGYIRSKMSSLAEELGIYLCAGSIPVADTADKKCFAVSFLYDPEGNEIGHYEKIHLFDALVEDSVSSYQESKTFLAGKETIVVDTKYGRIGLAICYDLRFPELFESLRKQGAEIILLPSAFTFVTGKKHWEVLVRARAIEQQCYVVACNQGGEHESGRKTWGHSMIVDPDGNILQQAEMGEAIICAEIDLELLGKTRASMPVQNHKKLV